MRTINTEFYGDDSRWFIGVVKQIGDIRKLGRVRVRIFGIHNEDTNKVKESDLPWASVVVPVTQGGIAGSTMPDGIQVGAQVYGIFLDGKHSQSPLVLGSIPHNTGFRVVTEEPEDKFALPLKKSQQEHTKAGDTVNDRTVKILEEAGVTPLPGDGEPITADMARIINDNSGNSGDLNITLVGANRQEQAYNFLKNYFEQRGNINDPGSCAAAFVGNFIRESGVNLDPEARPPKEPAVGIAQWNARQPDLKKFARSIPGASYLNFSVQLAFVIYELEHGQKNRTYARLVNASTILEYTEVVMVLYETPGVVVDYHKETDFINNYNTYAARGGIAGAIKRSSRQSTALLAFKSKLDDRLSSAKAVKTTYGDA